MGKYRRIHQKLEDSIEMAVNCEKTYHYNFAYGVSSGLERKARMDLIYVEYIRQLIPVTNLYWGEEYHISTPLRTVISIQSYFLDQYNTFIEISREALDRVLAGDNRDIGLAEALLIEGKGETF